MRKEAITAITALVAFLEQNRNELVIDADTHPSNPELYPESLRQQCAQSPNYFHGRPISCEELLQEMDMAGVDMALSWQNPAVTPYGDDFEANYRALLAANAYIHTSARRYPTRIIPAGWTDPKALGPDLALRLVEQCILDFGFLVVKMNPAQNAFPIDSEAVLRVVDHIVALGGIPAFHFGADTPYTPTSGFEQVARRHPKHPIIGIHMGGGGCSYLEGEHTYHEARSLGLRQANIHYVQSAKRDTHIESDLITYALARPPYSRNLSVASDAPYGRVSWNFGGYRQMFETLRDAARHPDPRIQAHPGLFSDEVVANFMGGNLADLLIRGYRKLLKLHPLPSRHPTQTR